MAEMGRGERVREGKLTSDLDQVGGLHIQHDSAGADSFTQLKERVQREGRHMGLGPTLTCFLHILLKLNPPEGAKDLMPVHTRVRLPTRVGFFTVKKVFLTLHGRKKRYLL